MSKEEIEAALIEAVKFAEREGKCPKDVYVEGYGWIIRNGQSTEAGVRYFEEVLKKGIQHD